MSYNENNWGPQLNINHAPTMPHAAPHSTQPKKSLFFIACLTLVVLTFIAVGFAYLLLVTVSDTSQQKATNTPLSPPTALPTKETVTATATATVTRTQHVLPDLTRPQESSTARFKRLTVGSTECTNSEYVVAAKGGSDYYSICFDGSEYTYHAFVGGGVLTRPAELVAHNEFQIDANPYWIVSTPSLIQVIEKNSGEVVRTYMFTDWETKN